MKRLLDILVSSAAIVVASPLWVPIALLIRLTSTGPVLFRQRHAVGRDGRPFVMYKFRTMRADSDDRVHREAIARFTAGEAVDQGRGAYKVVDDPRVTPIGRWLRRTSLDELPQFLNVIKGDMSIVGPRPPVTYEYEQYGAREKARLSVRPGITGLYQVTARSKVAFDEMIRIDLEYIDRRSLLLDLWIMVRTPFVMLAGRGAY